MLSCSDIISLYSNTHPIIEYQAHYLQFFQVICTPPFIYFLILYLCYNIVNSNMLCMYYMACRIDNLNFYYYKINEILSKKYDIYFVVVSLQLYS
jgi:hypothetical protein